MFYVIYCAAYLWGKFCVCVRWMISLCFCRILQRQNYTTPEIFTKISITSTMTNFRMMQSSYRETLLIFKDTCTFIYIYPDPAFIESDELYSRIISLGPRDAYICRCTRSSLVHIMACRLLGARSLSEPMLTYSQLGNKEQNSVKYQSKFEHFHSRKRIWKYHLESGGRLVSASMC